MNVIWTVIMLVSIVIMAISSPENAVIAMTAGANDAVSLTLSLLATYALWLGLFALIEKTGIARGIAKILKKPLKFLFPGESEEAYGFISMNMSANFLGLGNAATPMGISAVENMVKEGDKASDNMLMFLVISSASIQLLPTTVIGMRAASGSSSPISFLPACITATAVSAGIGITIIKIMSCIRHRRRHERKERARCGAKA